MPDLFMIMSTTTVITAGIASAATAIPKKPSVVQIYNAGTVAAFITFGNSAVVTTLTGGFPVPPGNTVRLEKGENEYIATIVGSTTAALYLTVGLGL